LLSAPQQYVAQRAQWFRANVTGGSTMASLFAVTPQYAAQKLAMLFSPFLGRWSYVRSHEPASNAAGGSRWRPPCADVNAPDLYLPLLAAWTYALLVAAVGALSAAGGRAAIFASVFGSGGGAAAVAAGGGAATPAAAGGDPAAAAAAAPTPAAVASAPPALAPLGPPFKPDVFSGAVYSAAVAWLVHWAAARLLLRGMGAGAGAAVPWSELAAYTGYAFAPVCAAVLAGIAGGPWAYYAAWLYGSACMAAFMVRTMKRVLFQEARAMGGQGGGGGAGSQPQLASPYGGAYGAGGGYGGGGMGMGMTPPPPADLKSANYLLLALALFQFPWAWWLGVRA
jgi:hypothetical protein